MWIRIYNFVEPVSPADLRMPERKVMYRACILRNRTESLESLEDGGCTQSRLYFSRKTLLHMRFPSFLDKYKFRLSGKH